MEYTEEELEKYIDKNWNSVDPEVKQIFGMWVLRFLNDLDRELFDRKKKAMKMAGSVLERALEESIKQIFSDDQNFQKEFKISMIKLALVKKLGLTKVAQIDWKNSDKYVEFNTEVFEKLVKIMEEEYDLCNQ